MKEITKKSLEDIIKECFTDARKYKPKPYVFRFGKEQYAYMQKLLKEYEDRKL